MTPEEFEKIGPIKVVYFKLRARAEVPRLIMHAAGVKFEDATSDDWKTVYADHLKFGQMPLLIHGSKSVVQSNAIIRYLARNLDLAGSTEEERCLVDEMHEGTEDLNNAFWPTIAKYRGGTQEKLDETLSPAGAFYKYLTHFDKICAKCTGKGYFLGDKISYADLALYSVLSGTSAVPDGYLAKNFPAVQKHFEAVEAHPNIQKYISSGTRNAPYDAFTF